MRKRPWTLLIIAAMAIVLSLSAGCTARKSDPAPSGPAKPAEDAPMIIALGDSITYGPQTPRTETYPAHLERLLLERGYQYRVINSGQVSAKAKNGSSRMKSAISEHPALIILELGTNDYLAGDETAKIKQYLAGMLKMAQDAGVPTVLAGMEAPESIRLMYEELAREYNVPLIPDPLHGKVQEDMHDSYHCKPAGCRMIAEENVLPVILPLLKK